MLQDPPSSTSGPRAIVGFILLMMATACGSVRTSAEQRSDFDYAEFSSFAWVVGDRDTEFGDMEPGAVPVTDWQLAVEIRSAVTQRLESAGFINVAPTDADLLVRQLATVTEKLSYNDPYFSFYTAERYEDGSITIQFVEPRSGTTVWSGTGTLRLRAVARGIGLEQVRFVSTGEERDWRIRERVASILAEFPPLRTR